MNDNAPTQRTLRVGKVNIGLIHFDVALNKAMNTPDLTDDEAVELIYTDVAQHNYIPKEAIELYRQAIADEWQRQKGNAENASKNLTVRILGPGCVSCNRIYTMLIDVLQRFNLAADIEQIKELDEIWRHGVLTTPALIINDEIKCAGRMPTLAEMEGWIRQTERI